MGSGLDPNRDYIAEMDPAGSIIDSPATKLLWGAASHGGWPIKAIPEKYRRNHATHVEALVLMGNLEFASPHEIVENELVPNMKRGKLVVLSEMGHANVAKLQPKAFVYLASLFFLRVLWTPRSTSIKRSISCLRKRCKIMPKGRFRTRDGETQADNPSSDDRSGVLCGEG